MNHRQRGVSVLELAVIAAVVVMVVVIMVPVVNNARAKAGRSDCQSNMARIATAVRAYASDNNGLVPPSYYLHGATPAVEYVRPTPANPGYSASQRLKYPSLWTGRLLPYVSNRKYYICPLVTHEIACFYRPKPSNGSSPWTTYGMNWRFSNGGALGGSPDNPRKEYVGVVQTLDSPPIPGQTVLLIETQNKPVWIGEGKKPFSGEIAEGGNITPYRDTGSYFWAIRWLNKRDFTPYGHQMGCNVILADGHAAFIAAPQPPYPAKVSTIEQNSLSWW